MTCGRQSPYECSAGLFFRVGGAGDHADPGRRHTALWNTPQHTPHTKSVATRSALICMFTVLAPSLQASHHVGAQAKTHLKKLLPCQPYETLTAKYQRLVILLTR
jgi:hypothetical protein